MLREEDRHCPQTAGIFALHWTGYLTLSCQVLSHAASLKGLTGLFLCRPLFNISRPKARGTSAFSPGFSSSWINYDPTFTWLSASVTYSRFLSEIGLLVGLVHLTIPIPCSHISHSSSSPVPLYAIILFCLVSSSGSCVRSL